MALIESIGCRPTPPEVIEEWRMYFTPAPDMLDWVRTNIIDSDGALHNPDHAHLADAHIGFLWTNVENAKLGRQIIGQAEMPVFRCGKWQKARQEYQLEQWFGLMPDFVITLDAEWCKAADDVAFCALVEHELYHCSQERDNYGEPKFNRDTGEPIYTMKGHDVEEFIGVVRRYGTGQPDGPLAQLAHAAQRDPEVSRVDISRACGTCAATV